MQYKEAWNKLTSLDKGTNSIQGVYKGYINLKTYLDGMVSEDTEKHSYKIIPESWKRLFDFEQERKHDRSRKGVLYTTEYERFQNEMNIKNREKLLNSS